MVTREYLEGTKPPLKSKTIIGNIVAIASTVASAIVIVKSGVPLDIMVAALGTAVTAVSANVGSIYGRIYATEKVRKPRIKKKKPTVVPADPENPISDSSS